eukprot:38510-Hanusia_phi.AAC.1
MAEPEAPVHPASILLPSRPTPRAVGFPLLLRRWAGLGASGRGRVAEGARRSGGRSRSRRMDLVSVMGQPVRMGRMRSKVCCPRRPAVGRVAVVEGMLGLQDAPARHIETFLHHVPVHGDKSACIKQERSRLADLASSWSI